MQNRDDLFGGRSLPNQGMGGMGGIPFIRGHTKQEQMCFKCPSGCHPPLIVNAIPNPGAVIQAFARCLRCLTFWEVTPSGEVVNVQTIADTINSLLPPKGES